MTASCRDGHHISTMMHSGNFNLENVIHVNMHVYIRRNAESPIPYRDALRNTSLAQGESLVPVGFTHATPNDKIVVDTKPVP